MATLIAATSKSAMNALAFKGIMVYSCFPQLRDMLFHKFGLDYALPFAKPAENQGGGTIDWYSDIQGDPRPLADLPEEDQRVIRASLARQGAEIQKYADELIHAGDPLKVTRGNILKLSLRYPDDGCIYALGKQPVIVGWGFAPGTPGVEGKDISAPGQAPTPKAAAAGPVAEEALKDSIPVPPARGGAGCLWWLLPLLALLLVLLLLFSAFGNREALSGYSLLHLPPLPFMKEYADLPATSALENEIAFLTSQLAAHAAQCQPQAPPKAEKKPPQEAAGELVIPEKAENMAFMEGIWQCTTGLANRRTGAPVEVTFYFDKNGIGKGIILEHNDQCEGGATAKMTDGILHIQLGEQHCRLSGGTYTPVSIECENAHGAKTRCVGVNEDKSTWEAGFRRLR